MSPSRPSPPIGSKAPNGSAGVSVTPSSPTAGIASKDGTQAQPRRAMGAGYGYGFIRVEEQVVDSELSPQDGPRAQKSGGEDVSTSSSNVDAPSRVELDAKLAVVEAKTEARMAAVQTEMRVGFSEMRADVRSLSDRLVSIAESQSRLLSEQRSSRQWIIGTVVVVAIGSVGFLLADRSNILSSFQAGITDQSQQRPQQSAPPR